MATGTWWHGKSAGSLVFTAAGGSPATIQKISSEAGEEVALDEITHSGSNGVSSFIVGVLSGTFTFTAFLDTTSTGTKFYSTTVQIRAGVSGVISHPLTSSLADTIPITIRRVVRRVAVSGGVQYVCEAVLNGEVGTYTYAS